MPSVSLVLPAYNEAENIDAVLAEAIPALQVVTDDFEIIVVDDGSKDETGAVTRRAMERDPRVRLVQHAANQGFGASVFSGFVSGTKEWIFYTDADRQFVLNDLQKFVPLMSQADLIAGYRAPRRDHLLRVLYGKGWSMLCTLLFGYTVRDVDCGFKLVRRDVVQKLAPHIASRGATFSIEWLARARRGGYRFAELPVAHRPRVAGSQTGARISVITRAFRELVRLRVQLWRENSADAG